MKACVFVMLFGLVATPAFAQVAPGSSYIPITMDEANYNALIQYLQMVPYGYANPIIQGINGMEADAIKKLHTSPCVPSDKKTCTQTKP